MNYERIKIILKIVKYPLLLTVAISVISSAIVAISYSEAKKAVSSKENCSVSKELLTLPNDSQVTEPGDDSSKENESEDGPSDYETENGVPDEENNLPPEEETDEKNDVSESKPMLEEMKIKIEQYEEIYYEKSETIPFETKYVNDSSMLKGQYKTASEGKEGLKSVLYRILMLDGQELVSEVVKTENVNPVNKVIHCGTIENFKNSIGQTVAYSKKYTMSATAYAPTPENWGYQTYTGNTNRPGGVAVDPDVIPLGTKLYIKGLNGAPDYGFAIAWDTGGPIKDMKIDLFIESEDLCIQWGIRDVEVYILQDQSVNIFALRGDSLWVGQ